MNFGLGTFPLDYEVVSGHWRNNNDTTRNWTLNWITGLVTVLWTCVLDYQYIIVYRCFLALLGLGNQNKDINLDTIATIYMAASGLSHCRKRRI